MMSSCIQVSACGGPLAPSGPVLHAPWDEAGAQLGGAGECATRRVALDLHE